MRSIDVENVCELFAKNRKRRPVLGPHCPTFVHYFVHLAGAVLWRFHAVALVDVVFDVLGRDPRVRRAPVAEDFVEEDAETPHVRFDGEGAAVETLRRCPLDAYLGRRGYRRHWLAGLLRIDERQRSAGCEYRGGGLQAWKLVLVLQADREAKVAHLGDAAAV